MPCNRSACDPNGVWGCVRQRGLPKSLATPRGPNPPQWDALPGAPEPRRSAPGVRETGAQPPEVPAP